MNDIPPEYENLFNFNEDEGYLGPNFSGSREIGTSTLRAAITGMEFERDYLKSCEEYVVGFNQNAIQILRHNCVYGGIRDLQASISVLSHIRNLPAYLKQTYAGQIDISAVLKGFQTSESDLSVTFKGWGQEDKDLPVYLKQGYTDQVDLSVYLKEFYAQQTDLGNTVKGWSTGNVIDIINTIRIWYEDSEDIPAYLKTTTQDDLDLPTIVYKIWQHQQQDLNKALHGWQEAQLQKIIQALHISDLPVLIRSTYLTNLGAMLYAIQPVDISADLFGWAVQDLGAYIVDGIYEGDLTTYINSVPPKDLGFRIYAKQGIATPRDLNIFISNLPFYDLYSSINVMQYKDLNAYLESSRVFMDLQFKIYPKYVRVKHHINISFLEHRDLAAVVNFPCFGSAFRDLGFSVVIENSRDMRFYIFGYDNSNLKDLRCSINALDYVSQDTINVKYFYGQTIQPTVTVKYDKKEPIYSFNKITLWTDTFTRSFSDLSSSIVGNYLTKDLGAYIQAYSNLHYGSENIQEKFVTLKLKNNKEDFRRYVELTFNSYANSYTYFSGGRKAYRDFRNDHWVIRVEGHELLPVGRGFEKTKVRRKYIFNLRNYESIDEAIRDMIDRVTNMKSTDLGAYIESTNDRVANLSFRLMPKRIYKSNRTIKNSIKGVNSYLANLPINLNASMFKGENDLLGNITGIEHVNPVNGTVNFNFSGLGDSIPDPNDADFLFDAEDMNDGN